MFISFIKGAIVALSSQSDQSDLGAREWLSILRALAQKTITTGITSSLLSSFVSMDEEGETNQEILMQHILHGSSSISNLIRTPKCSIGDRIIIGDYPEIGSPQSSSSQIIGLGEIHSNGFPIPTSTSSTVPASAPSSSSSSSSSSIIPSTSSSTVSVIVPLSSVIVPNPGGTNNNNNNHNSNNDDNNNSNSNGILLDTVTIVKTESLKTTNGKKRTKAKVSSSTPVTKKLKRSIGR